MGTSLRARTYDELQQVSKPKSANQPEAFRHVLYDSQTFTLSSSTSLRFFGAQQSDLSLGNMQGQGGSLPGGEYFEIEEMCFDAMPVTGLTSSAGIVAGMLNDLLLLVYNSRPRVTLKYKSKDYGPVPLSVCRGLGHVNGGVNGTYTAPIDLQWAQVGQPGDGWFVSGGIILQPATAFAVIVEWPAVVATAVNYICRVAFRGTYYRPVS